MMKHQLFMVKLVSAYLYEPHIFFQPQTHWGHPPLEEKLDVLSGNPTRISKKYVVRKTTFCDNLSVGCGEVNINEQIVDICGVSLLYVQPRLWLHE